MLRSLAAVFAIALYVAAGTLLWLRFRRGESGHSAMRSLAFGLGSVGVALHASILYYSILAGNGLDLGLTSAVALVAWVVTILFLLASLTRPVETLGILIFPLAALTVLIESFWPSHQVPLSHGSPAQFTHIIVSLLAYSLLSIAVVQSLLMSVQEKHLHQKQPRGFLEALPPLETMESLMFQMIGLGFFLLTLTLISGVFFSEQVFGKPLAFTHHIVLSIFAWLVFAVLLFGRVKFGWRGRQAVRWAIGGFILLVLAYFGSKFVLEVLLRRY